MTETERKDRLWRRTIAENQHRATQGMPVEKRPIPVPKPTKAKP